MAFAGDLDEPLEAAFPTREGGWLPGDLYSAPRGEGA